MRIRTIKPEFFKNEYLSELPAVTRLAFIGLWTLADVDGRLEDRAKRIKAELFPYDNVDMDKSLNQLVESGFIVRYKVNANRLVEDISPRAGHTDVGVIQISNFKHHQRITGKEAETESKYPPPSEGETMGKQWGNNVETMDDSQLSRKGREGKGKERKGEYSHVSSEFFEEFLNVWNLNLPDSPKILKLSDGRKAKLRTRISNDSQFFDHFSIAVQKILESDFLSGKNKNGWKADFDWLIENDTNYLKVIEGKYGSNKSKNDQDFEEELFQATLNGGGMQ